MFSQGLDSGQAPMEFVNDMRKKGQFIMGIGHRVKSVRTCLVTLVFRSFKPRGFV